MALLIFHGMGGASIGHVSLPGPWALGSHRAVPYLSVYFLAVLGVSISI